MLSIPHLIVIFIVALVVFGPEKIPELARNLGKVMAEFRRVTGDLRSTFEGHLRDLEREADTRRIAATTPTVVPAPVASAPSDAPASPASPGTVPSKPPYAAAIAGASDAIASSNPEPSPSPGITESVHDPMHDPYMASIEFPAQDSTSTPEPSKTELNPEQVSDGDRHHS